MVEETYGVCKECTKEALLGEGLCVACWDAREDGILAVKGRARRLRKRSAINQLLNFKKVRKRRSLLIAKEDTLELLQAVDILLSSLTDYQRRVIIMRFGLKGEEHYTLAAVGQEFNVCRESIRQVEATALRRLRWQCYFGASKHLKVYSGGKESTTLGEVLLNAIFSMS